MSLNELMARTDTPCDCCTQGIESYLVDLYEIENLRSQPKLCHGCIGKRQSKAHPFDEIGLTEEEMISLGFSNIGGFWQEPEGVSKDRLLELLTDMRNMPPHKPHFCRNSNKNEEER